MLFTADGDGLSKSDWRHFQCSKIDLAEAKVTLVVKQSVIVFQQHRTIKVTRYNNVQYKSKMTVTQLDPLPCKDDLDHFAVCVIMDRYLLVTGGIVGDF